MYFSGRATGEIHLGQLRHSVLLGFNEAPVARPEKWRTCGTSTVQSSALNEAPASIPDKFPTQELPRGIFPRFNEAPVARPEKCNLSHPCNSPPKASMRLQSRDRRNVDFWLLRIMIGSLQ